MGAILNTIKLDGLAIAFGSTGTIIDVEKYFDACAGSRAGQEFQDVAVGITKIHPAPPCQLLVCISSRDQGVLPYLRPAPFTRP